MSVIVIATTLLFAPPSAVAATYDGQWADSTSCANSVITAREATITTTTQLGTVVGRVQLRYSLNCRTVWVRVLDYYQQGTDGFVKRNSDNRTLNCERWGFSSSLNAYYCLSKMLNDANVTSFAAGAAQYAGGNYSAWTSDY